MGQFDEQRLSQLVTAAQAGDQTALHDIIAWAMDYLFPAVLSMLHERRQKGTYISETLHTGGSDLLDRLRDDAWAVTHSACCRMTLRLDSFRGRNALGRKVQFGTWVYAIARNDMRALLRDRWRERKRYGGSRDELDGGRQLAGDTFTGHAPGLMSIGQRGPSDGRNDDGVGDGINDGASPEGAVLDQLDNELMREALEKAPLTPEQREAVVLFHGYGYRQEQIATMTGVQVGTVKKRIFDALRKLRIYMKERSAG